MTVATIIAEYNPFHKGHKLHIDETKKRLNADYVIVIMSGNFTQRGIPAILDKYKRTEIALKSGADLVIELPTIYACSSAEYFSYAGVYLADKLGITSYLSFGSETGELSPLISIAEFLNSEPEEYKKLLLNNLESGMSFPKARMSAIISLCPQYGTNLFEPNNTLGIEYIRALLSIDSKIKPFALKREGSSHNSLEKNSILPSSSAIRSELTKCFDTSWIKQSLPDASYEGISSAISLLFRKDFSSVMHYALICENEYIKYLDVSREISDKIKKHLPQYHNFEQFIDLLKTKELTHSRISRALIHILLKIPANIVKEPGYATLLGFKRKSADLLSEIKKKAAIPLISKNADYKKVLSNDAASISSFETDILAFQIYESVRIHNTNSNALNIFKTSPIIQ